jgi:DNA-binding transcriptional MerR regulator
MFTIGEFSRATALTIKTLRFYHDERILVPSRVDPATGYRYYDENDLETARVVTFLRSLDVPLLEVKEILRSAEDSAVADVLERHEKAIEERMRHYRKVIRSLHEFVEHERRMQARLQAAGSEVTETTLTASLIASVRMQGHYADCGKAFAKIGRTFRRDIAGPPFLLHHNAEYRENDADFEACFPVSRPRAVEGVEVRELPACRALTLQHRGSYHEIAGAYSLILSVVKERQYEILRPTREIYLRGPGIIFKGNPNNYITDIQIPIAA